MGQGFATTARVIIFSLFSVEGRGVVLPHAAGASSREPIPVPRRLIPAYLGQLDQAVDDKGKLALFFPDCAALAAPFLLFRLKREGFSACRATAAPDGLLVSAGR